MKSFHRFVVEVNEFERLHPRDDNGQFTDKIIQGMRELDRHFDRAGDYLERKYGNSFRKAMDKEINRPTSDAMKDLALSMVPGYGLYKQAKKFSQIANARGYRWYYPKYDPMLDKRLTPKERKKLLKGKQSGLSKKPTLRK
jgi:hypothetical protein